MHPETHQVKKSDGTPLTEKDIRRGLRLSIMATSIGMPFFVALGTPLTMFMEAIKANGVTIGMLGSIQQMTQLVQIPAAFIAEMLPVRKWFWFFTAIIHRVIWLFVPFIPYLWHDRPDIMAAAVMVVATTSAVIGQASASAWWSWISDLVPERSRSRFWSLRQATAFTSFLAATWLSGYLLDFFPGPHQPGGSFLGFAIVFALTGLFGTLDIITHLFVPEPRPIRMSMSLQPLKRLLAPLRQHDFRYLTGSMSIWGISCGLVGAFGALYLRAEMGISYTGISATAISSTVGIIISSFAWAYLQDRIGTRNFGIIMMLLAPLCGVAWFFVHPGLVAIPLFGHVFQIPQPVFVLTISSFIAGGFYSGVGLAQSNLLGSIVPREGRTMGMAVHFCIMGLLSAIGPVAGGYIMDKIKDANFYYVMPTGTKFGYIHALAILHLAVIWLFGATMLGRVRRQKGEMDFRTALSRVLIFNPLRMVSSVYNIYSMGASESRYDRANAIRRLGDERTALAITDFIEELGSPSLEVREEAATALGKLASNEAVAALLDKLDDKTADMTLIITRALRLARHPFSIAPLVQLIQRSDLNREIAVEAIRALGAIGDTRAKDPLIRLFQSSTDPKILIACSESLARMNCFSAAYDILPRIKTSHNATLNRSLTVNLGDLLGEPGGFYRFMTREESTKGSAAEAIFNSIRKTIRQKQENIKPQPAAAPLILDLTDRLEAAYLSGKIEEAIRLIYDITLQIAALDFNIDYQNDLDVFIETLLWHDERFAVGAWFASIEKNNLEKAGTTRPNDMDVLLGIYFLGGWARQSAA